MFVSVQLNYFDAAENCRNNRGQLFEPRRQSSQDKVTALVNRQFLDWTSYWIGVNDFLMEESVRGRCV